MKNNLQIAALEAARSRSFSSSLGKLPFWDHHGYMSKQSIILIGGAVVLVAGLYYWYSSGGAATAGSSAAPKRDPDQFAATLATMRKLKNINFDQSLFSEPAFLILQKPDIPTAPEVTPGRSNPFLPIRSATPPAEEKPSVSKSRSGT